MTPDPVTVSVVGGAAGVVAAELVKDVWKAGRTWLAEYFRDHAPKAQEQAEQNAAEFIDGLAVRINRLADAIGSPEMKQRVEAGLQDPDFSAVLKTAVLGAARSSSRVKHAALARAVAERLAAALESTAALASNIAVDAIPRLSVTHLHLLRVAAVVYAIRPAGLPRDREPPIDPWDGTEAERAALIAYPDWLRSVLAPVPREGTVGDGDFTHLASSGCVVLERRKWLDIYKVLKPTERWMGDVSRAFDEHLGDVLWGTDEGRALRSLWEGGLRNTILVPAGLLIGTAVHDVQNQTETSINWATVSAFLAPPEKLQILDDQGEIREDFMDVLERRIKDLAGRDVGIWRNLDTR